MVTLRQERSASDEQSPSRA